MGKDNVYSRTNLGWELKKKQLVLNILIQSWICNDLPVEVLKERVLLDFTTDIEVSPTFLQIINILLPNFRADL